MSSSAELAGGGKIEAAGKLQTESVSCQCSLFSDQPRQSAPGQGYCLEIPLVSLPPALLVMEAGSDTEDQLGDLTSLHNLTSRCSAYCDPSQLLSEQSIRL